MGVAGLKSLSFSDKLKFRKVANEIKNTPLHSPKHQKLDQITVQEWLNSLGQSSTSRKVFWDPLVIATLNEDPAQASAYGLLTVLQQIMQGSPSDARLGMATMGLSDLYTAEAQRIIEEKGGQVRTNAPVAALEMNGSEVSAVQLASGEKITADVVISALPPMVLARMAPAFREFTRFKTSPIISINLWLDRPITDALFVGFVGTRVQWLFNKPAILRRAGIKANYLALILSAAHDFIGQSNETLVHMALEDLRACFPAMKEARLIRSQVIREKDATVSLTVGMEAIRPGPRCGLRNLFLSGDWTSTGLPATIESAVVSGQRCAEEILKALASPEADRYNKVVVAKWT